MLAPSDGAPLRQGDVCALPHIPIWDLNKSSPLLGAHEGQVQMPTWQQVQRTTDDGCLVVVCSQCCDLENPRDRSGVLVAPLRKVPAQKGDSRYSAIMGSATPDQHQQYTYVQLFPITLGSGDDRDVVADLSALTTVAPAGRAIADLTAARLWTMEDDLRRQFRIKLAFMVGRDPDAKVRPAESD